MQRNQKTRNTMACGALALAAMTLTSVAPAEWLAAHLDASHNAVVPIASIVTDADVTPVWTTGAGNLVANSRALVSGSAVYALSFDTAAIATVRAFNRATGTPLWTSPDLDAENTITLGTASSGLLNPGANALFYAVGETMYRLDTADSGAIDWSTEITELNTGAGRSLTVVNSSPASDGGNLVMVQTASFAGGDAQLVAFDINTGAIAWSVVTGGNGVNTPLVVTTGLGTLAIVDAVTASGTGLIAYDVVDGSVVWSNDTAPTTWDIGADGFWGDLVFDNGSIWGFTYNFGATGQLVQVDPTTGNATIFSSLGGDIPPVIAGGVIHGLGGGFGAAEFHRYDQATGANLTAIALDGGGQYLFRNYPAATNDAFYVATSDGFGSGDPKLFILNPATGAVLSESTTEYTGSVTLLSDGMVLTYGTDGSLNALAAPPSSVGDWRLLER